MVRSNASGATGGGKKKKKKKKILGNNGRDAHRAGFRSDNHCAAAPATADLLLHRRAPDAPAFPVTMIVLYIKYRTMRFRFDHEGIWKRQGLLWRHETNVAYRRIQDIHLTNGHHSAVAGARDGEHSNGRWFLNAEVTIDGVLEAEALRDYLYTKMRGVRDGAHPAAHAGGARALARLTTRRWRSHGDSRLASPARNTFARAM
jgi:putative membrane protein